MTIDRDAMVSFVRHHHRMRTGFDGYFDANDAARLYCAEFVARALEAGGAAPIEKTPISVNPSVGVALRWLKIEASGVLLAGSLIDESNRAALIARRHSVQQVNAYQAMKRELHRGFATDQRLGNVFEWRGQTLRLRPAVADYYETGRWLAALGEFDVDPDRAAHLLAERVFEYERVAQHMSRTDASLHGAGQIGDH